MGEIISNTVTTSVRREAIVEFSEAEAQDIALRHGSSLGEVVGTLVQAENNACCHDGGCALAASVYRFKKSDRETSMRAAVSCSAPKCSQPELFELTASQIVDLNSSMQPQPQS